MATNHLELGIWVGLETNFDKVNSHSQWIMKSWHMRSWNMRSWGPECLWHHREESPLHYFTDCFLYLRERQTMFLLFEHNIPSFRIFTKKKKIYTILNGININQDEFMSTNITLTFGVQKFIMETERFPNCWLLLFFLF